MPARTSAAPDPAQQLDAIRADARRHGTDGLSSGVAAQLVARTRDALTQIIADSATLDEAFGAHELDASAEDAAAHRARLAALAFERRRAEAIVAELEKRHGEALTREARAADAEVIAAERADRVEGRREMLAIDKLNRSLGMKMTAEQARFERSSNRMADLERRGYTRDEILGDTPETQLPPGALATYRGQLLWDLVPLLPSAVSIVPHFGVEHGVDLAQEAEERRANDLQVAEARGRIRAEEARALVEQPTLHVGSSSRIGGGGFGTGSGSGDSRD